MAERQENSFSKFDAVVLDYDPEAPGRLRYLVDTIPATFPRLRITPDAERDTHNWIKREDLEKSLEEKTGNPTSNTATLNQLESLGALQPRLKGNDASVIYGLVDTIAAMYAVKLQSQTTSLSDIPIDLWPALRNLIEKEIKNKRNRNQSHVSHTSTKDSKNHFTRYFETNTGGLLMVKGRKVE